MAKNLVIVESPAKAKTIEKFLGKDFHVESSYGHIADLPSKELGVAIDGDFKPSYIVSSDKKGIVKKLKDLAKKAEIVWLASDEDREGEAIAWHLVEQLRLKEEKTKRIVFNEITKNAILKAVENPRDINYDLVNAQQARRVLDRLVGYELSPVLWRKVRRGLSAGRVQSVSVRLIVEREREIENFKPQISFRVDAEFMNSSKTRFKAKLVKNLFSESDAMGFLNSCIDAKYHVADLQKKPAKKSPAPPFITSSLQQEASRKLGFTVSRTMLIAQKLYEAGLITYMRTDSVHLSRDARKAAQKEIISSYGESFSKPRNFSNKSKSAQEAHEAIRPTNISNHEISAEYDQNRLYKLIWKRTMASQMSEAQLERTTVKIENDKNNKLFVSSGEVITFEGFLRVYLEDTSLYGKDNQTDILPALKQGEALKNYQTIASETYTRPPYRFTEASLVKKLEELGIGRPSTYAPTISTIQKRQYVEKGVVEGKLTNYVQLILKDNIVVSKSFNQRVGSDKGKLVPTDIGNIVNDFLVANFSNILDFGFTAKVESDFDDIAQGKEDWSSMIKEFYNDFHPVVEDVVIHAERAKGQRLLGVDPVTGKNVYVRLGKYGAMIQIGEVTDEEKPRFASLQVDQSMSTITYEEAMQLFELPKVLGEYQNKEIVLSNGRFGPYIRFDGMFVSLDKGENPMTVDLERAKKLIEDKKSADAPVGYFNALPIQKGVGRFGPFIKWDSMFINVSKKYDFDNLSLSDMEQLIKDKIQKEKEKLIHHWEEEGIRVEKARWGRFNVIKGKTKVELPKTTDIEKVTKAAAIKMIQAKTSKKKVKKK